MSKLDTQLKKIIREIKLYHNSAKEDEVAEIEKIKAYIATEIIGEDDDGLGVATDLDGDPLGYEEIRNQLRAEQRNRLEQEERV